MSACSVCGEEHDSVRAPASWPEDIPLSFCPKIPSGFVYLDERFETGPPGRLFSLAEFRRATQR